MVSSTLEIERDELLATLERLRTTCAGDPEYVELRSALPEDWPM